MPFTPVNNVSISSTTNIYLLYEIQFHCVTKCRWYMYIYILQFLREKGGNQMMVVGNPVVSGHLNDLFQYTDLYVGKPHTLYNLPISWQVYIYIYEKMLFVRGPYSYLMCYHHLIPFMVVSGFEDLISTRTNRTLLLS